MRTRHVLAAPLLLIALLAGCSSGSDAGVGDAAADRAGSGGGAAEAELGTEVGDADDRQVVVTASAAVVAEDVAAAADGVAALAEAAGGRVESREEAAAGADPELEPGWADLVLRVPAEELQTLLGDLDDVGDVRQVSQTQTDVTDVARDLDARIEALETSTDRLLAIMADADDAGDLLATEDSLSERQADLEALRAERDALAGRVAMSTLQVSLSATEPTPLVARGGFLGGLESGWSALVATAGVVLVAVGAVLPWSVVVAVLLGAVLLVRRLLARGRAARA